MKEYNKQRRNTRIDNEQARNEKHETRLRGWRNTKTDCTEGTRLRTDCEEKETQKT